MKKTNLFVILLAIVTLGFMGCEPEQSQMDLTGLTDSATVTGMLVYDAGVDTAGSPDQYAINQIKPVVGRNVYVEIPFASYNLNSTAQKGNKIYTVVTDADGKYEITIPVTSEGLQNVTIRMEEFTAYRSEFKKMEDGKPVFETEMYRYDWSVPSFTLKAGAHNFLDDAQRTCNLTKVELDALKDKITLVGTAKLAKEAGFRQGVYEVAAKMPVTFVVQYPGMPGSYEFGTMTDAEGNYKITLPYNQKDGFAQLGAVIMAGSDYVHYSTPATKQALQGFYYNDALSPLNIPVLDGQEYRMPDLYLKFVTGLGSISEDMVPTSYTENLVGWEKYDGYSETVTVSGKYLLAQSAEYGKGTFANPYGEARFLVNYNNSKLNDPYSDGYTGKVLYAPADAEGNFSFELPVADATEVLTVTPLAFNEVPAGSVEYDRLQRRVMRFNHNTVDKVVVLEGKYASAAKRVVTPGAQWNDLGENYFLFAPDASVDKAKVEWSDNLVDWVVDKKKQETVKVTAKVFFAAESAYGVAKYVPATGRMVTVTAGGEQYAAAVKDGVLELNIPVENANAELTIGAGDVALVDDKVDDFVHFTADKQVKLAGNYVQYKWFGEDVADREAWNNLGEIYFKFNTTATSDMQKRVQWNDNLAGWFMDKDRKLEKVVTGNLHKAVETAFYVGDYVPFNNVVVEVTVDGEKFAGVTNAEGAYSIPVKIQYNEDPAIAVAVPCLVDYQDFTHFRRPGSSETEMREVKYGNEFTNFEKDINSWNDRKDTYYKVISIKDAPAYWSTQLVGWEDKEYRVAKKMTKTLTVTASVKRAVESKDGSNWAAKWENDAYRIVTVTVAGRTYDMVANGSGAISFVLNVKKVETDYTVAIVGQQDLQDKKDVVMFKHYPEVDKADSETVRGKFASAKNIDGGTPYTVTGSTVKVEVPAKMLFVPQTTPTGWGNYDWSTILDDK